MAALWSGPEELSSRNAWGSWEHDVLNNIGNHERFTIYGSMTTGANTMNGDRYQGTDRDTGSQQFWHTALIR